jgi:KDO2-lipid IV(A) lauroyltransferase
MSKAERGAARLTAAFRLLGRLPLSWGYAFSSLMAWVLEHGVRYRRAVVEDNLRRAFPGDPVRLRRRAYYRHLTDLLVEIVALTAMRDEEILRRVRIDHPELKEVLLRDGGLLLTSHCGNFEWLHARLVLEAGGRKKLWGIYTPLKNELMEAFFYHLRTHHGLGLIPSTGAFRRAQERLEAGEIVGIVADQSPHRDQAMLFVPFLGRPTAFHTSPARLMQLSGRPALYAGMVRERRGYYCIQVREIPFPASADPEAATAEITQRLAREVEETVRQYPPGWLWSHRRWKHKAPSEAPLAPAEAGPGA